MVNVSPKHEFAFDHCQVVEQDDLPAPADKAILTCPSYPDGMCIDLMTLRTGRLLLASMLGCGDCPYKAATTQQLPKLLTQESAA